MEFTGERFIPTVESPQISYEHWHRYLYACQFAPGRLVLDVACGEGYGANLLADVAKHVIGIDSSAEAIEYAASKYVRPNLEFRCGKAESLPIEGMHICDIAVSFETIEHLDESGQLSFLREIKRILKPGGTLIISTPNKLAYSDKPGYRNEFHKKEFYPEEYLSVLGQSFQHVHLLGQRVYPVSYVWPLARAGWRIEEFQLEFANGRFQPVTMDKKEALYVLAICSGEELEPLIESVLVDVSGQAITRGAVQLEQKEHLVRTLSRQVAEQEHTVQELTAQVAAKDRALEKVSAQVAMERRAVQVSMERNRTTAQTIAQLGARIGELSRAAIERDAKLAAKQQTIDVVLNSRSWRLTWPLRFAGSALRRWADSSQTGTVRESASNAGSGGDSQPMSVAQGDAAPAPDGRGQILQQAFQEMFARTGHISAATDYVHRVTDRVDAAKLEIKAIAFYLPQFHPIPENDEWWGKGFTEWTNVSKAVPRYVGQYQPHLPGELGFYDLRVPEVMRQQIDLAKQYGIYGFCFHYYWFGGRRLLERPLNQFLGDPTLDLKFCLCWANENWTRRWDGLENEVLIRQDYSPDDDLAFLESVAPAFGDPRYIRIDGKPLLIVYRASVLPDAAATATRWRKRAAQLGFPGLYLVAARSFDVGDPRGFRFDAAVEFPPHQLPGTEVDVESLRIDPHFAGHVYNYADIPEERSRLGEPPFVNFQTVMTGWDNEARQPGAGHSFLGATPELYVKWLSEACRRTVLRRPEERLLFINSWNEWAEGAHLEPDRKFGYAYLHATANVLRNHHNDPEVLKLIEALNGAFARTSDVAIILHCHYEDLIAPMFELYLSRLKGADLFVTVRTDISRAAIEEIGAGCPNVYVLRQVNRGRDIRPFLLALRHIRSRGYVVACKVHTKKSVDPRSYRLVEISPDVPVATAGHRQTRAPGHGSHWEKGGGEVWRQRLLEPLLGSSESVARAAQIFSQESDVGLLVPSGCLMDLRIRDVNVLNTFWLDRLLASMDRSDLIGNYAVNFPAGSMYWFRVAALAGLDDLILEEDAFEPELGQVDGTLAHAVERLVTLYAQERGYRTIEIPSQRQTGEPSIDAAMA